MPRKPRVHFAGAFYHVILRGNARQVIFLDRDDRVRWEALLSESIRDYDAQIHAYCWMTNHVHMAVRAGDQPIGGCIGVAASRYAKAFNKKYKRSGHLFERRHRAILMRDDPQLLQLIRYIHQNPIRAELVAELNHYEWSSHAGYLGLPALPLLTTRFVLRLFGNSLTSARHHYLAFMGEQPDKAVVAQLNDEKWIGEVDRECDLNSAEIHESTNHGADESLEERITRLCREYDVSESELAGRSKNHRFSRIRARITSSVVEDNLATVSEMARRFNRSQPALSRAVNRLRRRKQSVIKL